MKLGLYLRGDVPTVYRHASTVEHLGYVVQTLALGGGRVFAAVVFLHVHAALTRHGQIFVPVDRHLMGATVAAPLAHIGHALLYAVAMGKDGDAGIAVGFALGLGLQDAVGHTARMLEAVLTGQRIFPVGNTVC